MKRGKKLLFMLMLVLAVCTSCSTERRALHQMRGLTHDIETKGQYYDNQDWKEAYAKYQRIDDKMDVKKLNDDEQKEYGELQARCVTSFAKCKVESVIDAVKAYINQGTGIINGLIQLFK